MSVEIVFRDGTITMLKDVYAVERIDFELQIKQLTNSFMFQSSLYDASKIKKIVINV